MPTVSRDEIAVLGFIYLRTRRVLLGANAYVRKHEDTLGRTRFAAALHAFWCHTARLPDSY